MRFRTVLLLPPSTIDRFAAPSRQKVAGKFRDTLPYMGAEDGFILALRLLGYGIEEIAVGMGVTPAAAWKRLRKAVEGMKERQCGRGWEIKVED